ncbi:MAG TPA: DUF5020 family protein [Ignavibacteriaceae bacterium]|nr:DUF5020 family protein [Ignavibacteriaceae bacterium]
MKKALLILVILVASKSFAQNLQLHYDFGKERKYFTSTLEMFKPDEYGATFFFVDFDYNLPGNNSISLAYFEIARYVNVYDKLSVTIQYNDGLVLGEGQPLNYAFTLNQTWLGGVSYPINLGFVTLNTDLLFRKTYGSEAPDGQVTIVWYVPFLDNKLSFSGFLDFWSQDIKLRNFLSTSDKKEMVFLTEPQIWYNVWNHLSVGTEIEISNNFLPNQNEVKVNPTLAAKWNF